MVSPLETVKDLEYYKDQLTRLKIYYEYNNRVLLKTIDKLNDRPDIYKLECLLGDLQNEYHILNDKYMTIHSKYNKLTKSNKELLA